jgi:hypothetical protein
MGKTTMLVQVPQAAKVCGYDYPMLVSVPNRIAMAEFHKGLLKTDWDINDTAYVYGLQDIQEEARKVLPERTSSDEWPSKRLLLCCHALIDNSREDLELLSSTQWEGRTVFYDESLQYGDVFSFSLDYFKDELNALRRYLGQDARNWFQMVLDSLFVVHKRDPEPGARKVLCIGDRNSMRPSGLLEMVEWAESKYIEQGRYEDDKQRIRVLKSLADIRYDHIRVHDTGFFCFSDKLPNIPALFVLDASYKHSRLTQKDQQLVPLGLGLAKRFDNVKVIAHEGSNSKGGITKKLDQHLTWIQSMYSRFGKDALYIVLEKHKQDVINKLGHESASEIIHWGIHTGLNKYSDRRHLVCLGLWKKSHSDIAAKMALVEGNHFASFADTEAVAHEEAILDLYQAVSRGKCRNVEVDSNGVSQAVAMTIHLSGSLTEPQKSFLERVMPGIKYYDEANTEWLELINSRLNRLAVTSIPSVDLKKATGLTEANGITKYAWNKLIAALETEGKWYRDNRTIKLRENAV